MRIAWFTPFQPKSAIGHVSKLVCEALQNSCEPEIYTFDQGETISTSVPVVKNDSINFNTKRLENYDYVVYNMGNYAGNHREIWEIMQKYEGILLLHDQFMQNFFYQITMGPKYGGNAETGEAEYLRIMRECYGNQGEAAGKGMYKPYFGEGKVRIWDSDAATGYPLLEPILAKAIAVFSHADFFINNIKTNFYGPTGYAYLPYIPKLSQKDPTIPPEFADTTKALVVSVGLVHPVKRIDRVVEMLLTNPDIAKRVQYAVIGDYGGFYGDYLRSLAQGPLKGCLYLLGYQPDEIMEAFLQKADFCVNLRYPNSEVCSKSLIEQMAFGKPVIVIKRGIFDEFPDECVVKINIENELSELATAFLFLIDEKEKRLEIGQHAAEFVKLNCTPKEYVSRFISFLEKIPATIAANNVINDCIHINRLALKDLSFNANNIPWVVDATSREISKVTCATPINLKSNNVLGIWLGFPYVVSLRREGITKFLLYMLLSMLQKYPISCELWTYSINEEEIRISFEAILNKNDFKDRVKVITEKNYKEVLEIPSNNLDIPWDVNEILDNLALVARKFSKASRFITAIVYLDNVIGTGKQLFVPVHDLGIHSHYDDFVSKDPLYKARYVDIHSRAENFARSGAYLFSNSEFVRHEHVLKYISCVDESQTGVVYLPVNIPENLHENLLSEKIIRQKFSLRKPYIFYPSQVRPYKNILVLVEALSILRERNININLVLTGTPSDVPEVDMAIKKHKLNDRIICLTGVLENELFSLYRYAAVAAVPTLFEGGFPWQACEALFIDTPLVLSDIPVVRERIEFCGMSLDNCGLELFDPYDPAACADALERVIQNRDKTLASQRRFSSKFLSYTWEDAATEYYQLFFRLGEVNNLDKNNRSRI